MNTVSLFPIGSITREEFFRTFWRQRPLHVKGYGDQLSVGLDEASFAGLVSELERSRPNQVRRRGQDVMFAQNLDLCSAKFRNISKTIRLETSWPSVWFDGILAGDSSGVGFHCDPNDNFILQQSGTKLWRLVNPTAVSHEVIKNTMLGNDSTLAGDASSESSEFVVEPGDILYIPVLWPHHGISKGRSLSCTLVANADNALSLLPLLYMVLSDIKLWWSPLPMPQILDPETKAMLPIDQDLSVALDQLLESLSSEQVRAALKREWWQIRYQQLTS